MSLARKINGVTTKKLSLVQPQLVDANYYEDSIVGDFRIKRVLGQGGIATVYLARQLSLDRLVALKVSSCAVREAKIIASLENENIVKVYSQVSPFGKDQNAICMQYIRGSSLANLFPGIQDNPTSCPTGKEILRIIQDNIVDKTIEVSTAKNRMFFSRLSYLDSILFITSQIAKALHFAHTQGILHLDVKPGNILLDNSGKPYLTDFNLSYDFKNHREAQRGGSGRYMSPEQRAVFEGKSEIKLSPQSDIYSLGTVLKDFAVDNSTEVSEEVIEIVDKATRNNPEERYESAIQLSKVLDALLDKRLLERSIPEKDWFLRVSTPFPYFALTFCLVLPSILGSSFDLLYLYYGWVAPATGELSETFLKLNLFVKPAIYLIGVTYWLWNLRQVKYLYTKLVKNELQSVEISHLRKLLLRLPSLATYIISIGWLTSSVAYPLIFNMVSKLEVIEAAHIVTAFVFSWMACFSYTFILQEYLVLRLFFPAMVYQDKDQKYNWGLALLGINKHLKFVYRVAFSTPLIGAILLIWEHGDKAKLENFPMKIFILTCIAVGMFGGHLVLQYSNKISQTLKAYQNINKKRRFPW